MLYKEFTKENIEFFLRELAKTYKKLNRNGLEAEVILVGGAASLISYNFRDITTDIDGIIMASSSFREAINIVGDKYGLPNGWLNSDFMRTKSYSPKLREYSKYYKSFYGALSVRIVEAEYFVAMKLISGRIYKKDLSDIVGVLGEQKRMGKPLNYEQIVSAVIKLYGNVEVVGNDAWNMLDKALKDDSLTELYESLREDEQRNRDALKKAEVSYSQVIKEDNVNEFIRHFRTLDSDK